ncbi:lytic murein transglycosylase B [Enterobacteriaceae bacterium LUAb1]
MRYLPVIFSLFMLLTACSRQHESAEFSVSAAPQMKKTAMPSGEFLLAPEQTSAFLKGDFANNLAAEQFIDRMVHKHNFDRQQLYDFFSQAKRLDYVLRLMEKQAPSTTIPHGPNGAWIRYRNKFITPGNVQNGVVFWNQYQDALQRAWKVYGVPPEIIVGIIGVETRWGRVMGKTRILDALATLSFNYPRRADYFSGELETFLLMTRSEKDDPLMLCGSFAGAMGYAQFMPSSFQAFAVDFNHDGHTNLWDPEDAIGSVAHYFQQHGWRKGDAVAIPATGQAPGLEQGFNTHYSPARLAAAGLSPQSALGSHDEVSLLRLDLGTSYQYWYGLPNFYAITRYNHSTHYAMAVWQLGEAVSKARQGHLLVN